MKWCYDHEKEVVVFDDSKYSWIFDGEAFIMDVRRGLDDNRHSHQKLIQLYECFDDSGITER